MLEKLVSCIKDIIINHALPPLLYRPKDQSPFRNVTVTHIYEGSKKKKSAKHFSPVFDRRRAVGQCFFSWHPAAPIAMPDAGPHRRKTSSGPPRPVQ